MRCDGENKQEGRGDTELENTLFGTQRLTRGAGGTVKLELAQANMEAPTLPAPAVQAREAEVGAV